MVREVFESPEFASQRKCLGAVRLLDERMRGLTWALWTDAEDFPLISPDYRLRATTLLGDPRLTVWFEIPDGKEEEVVLRWIEQAPAT